MMHCFRCNHDESRICKISTKHDAVLRTHTCGNCRLDFTTIEVGLDQPQPLIESLMVWVVYSGLDPQRHTLAEVAQMLRG